MRKKQFKTESQKLLDMMINSIYTHKEIFLRELISNASDALDKLYFRSLTDSSVAIGRGDYAINIISDKDARTLTITDNGCGIPNDKLNDIMNGVYTSNANVSDGRITNSGIGLSVCASIIKAHEGDIKAENAQNGGCVFRFVLNMEEK